MSSVNAGNLASSNTIASGIPIDGITCAGNQAVKWHIYAHVTIYVNDKQRRLPAVWASPDLVLSNTIRVVFLLMLELMIAFTGYTLTPMTISSTPRLLINISLHWDSSLQYVNKRLAQTGLVWPQVK
ncbi:MAG: hypothetical protein M1483_01300 [Actinobacteria bacterium]|nr:hypothetical protein [Actinomycetota bacterium]MCL6104270.1 hypothetical protein [Actinomycetota bacterium]